MALDLEDEKLVKNEEERIQLERRRKMQRLAELIEGGEKDLLEMELMSVDHDQLATYRDDRGNNYTILYYTIIYYTILYYTILYYTILYYNILYYNIIYYTIIYYTILYYIVL